MPSLNEQANEAVLVFETRTAYQYHTVKDMRLVIATLNTMIFEKQHIRAGEKYLAERGDSHAQNENRILVSN